MSDDEVQLKVRVPSDLKEVVDSHPDYNKELVEKALRNQLRATGKTALDLRIEQKERRIDLIDDEIDELKEERADHVEDLNNLLQQREEQRDGRYQIVEEAVEFFEGESLAQAQAEHWADKAEMNVEEFKEAYNEVRDE